MVYQTWNRPRYVNVISLGFGTYLSMLANHDGAPAELGPKGSVGSGLPAPPVAAPARAPAMITPIDRAYQWLAGEPPTATFWSTEGAVVTVVAAWSASAVSLVLKRAVVGRAGLACATVGVTIPTMEAIAIFIAPRPPPPPH